MTNTKASAKGTEGLMIRALSYVDVPQPRRQQKELQEVRMSNEDIVPGFDKELDDSITIRLQKINDRCLVLCLKGQLDLYNYANAKKRIDLAIEEGFVNLIADCRQLNYVSSTGVGLLVEVMKKTKLCCGDIILVYLQPSPLGVIELLGFQRFLQQAEDLNDAIGIFDSKEAKGWPITFPCPICNKRLKAIKAGRFRCVECKTILIIDPEMKVILG
jgi:anti-anti-sigma factor